MLISPEKPLTKTVARFSYTDNYVSIAFPEKRDDFRYLVKSRRYEWSYNTNTWGREVTQPTERVLEMATMLLGSGFVIDIDADLVERLQKRDFTKETTKWITAKDNFFRFHWYYHENSYALVMRLPAAFYDKPCVCVPMEYYREVLDFATIHEFEMKPSALELAERAQNELDNILFFGAEVDDTEIEFGVADALRD